MRDFAASLTAEELSAFAQIGWNFNDMVEAIVQNVVDNIVATSPPEPTHASVARPWTALLTTTELSAFTDVEWDFNGKVEEMIKDMVMGRIRRRTHNLQMQLKDMPIADVDAVITAAMVEVNKKRKP